MITVTEAFAHSLLLRGVQDVKILPNGADISTFKLCEKRTARKSIGFKDEDFLIIYSGVVGGYYALSFVVEALVDVVVDIPMVKLLIVGAGPALENVLRLSKEIGVQDYVFYLGQISDKMDLARILCGSDVGLVPYDANLLWKNSLPAKSFEYLACGLPIIATVYDDSMLGKLITKYCLGAISPPGDQASISQNIKKIYRDTYFRRDVSRRAMSVIEERFDRNKIAQKFLDLLV